MPFVNEFISDADVVAYGLERIDELFVGGTNARDWTIDRERNIYLRNMRNGCGSDPDLRSQVFFSFFWHGEAIVLRLDLVEGGGGVGEPGWSHWKLIWVGGWSRIPDHCNLDKGRFTDDLKAALVAYKDFGVYSTNTDYEVVLELGQEHWA